MDSGRFLRALDEVFELRAGTTQMNDNLEDISDLSSLTFVILIAAMDEQFGVTVSPEDLQDCRTVADLAELVSSGVRVMKKAA
jgi:acyl carrier protein